jgi:hypothetical protein
MIVNRYNTRDYRRHTRRMHPKHRELAQRVQNSDATRCLFREMISEAVGGSNYESPFVQSL